MVRIQTRTKPGGPCGWAWYRVRTCAPIGAFSSHVCCWRAPLLSAADWPQFLGPQRNGVYAGPPLATTWPAGGPRKVWEKRIGQGFAGPVVAGDRLILFHRVGREEVVDALDARTGEARWHFAYPTTYRDDFGFDEGPRAVPVVAGNRVYTFGAEGQLHAIDVATGRPGLERRHANALQREEGILRRRRIAAGRRRPRDRERRRHRRRASARGLSPSTPRPAR